MLKLKLENNTLHNKLDETDSKYRELRTKKIADASLDESLSEVSLIREQFEWLNSKDNAIITLENADNKTLEINKSIPLDALMFEGLNNKIIYPMSRFVLNYFFPDIHYTLKYTFKDQEHEILIFSDGVIETENGLYYSNELLCYAQALMPIVTETSLNFENALDVMFNAKIATVSTYNQSDHKDDLVYNEASPDVAARLRAAAYFIKQNMVLTNDVMSEDGEMNVTKSIGYIYGDKVEFYVFSTAEGVHHVKLDYKGIQKYYKIKPELRDIGEIKYFNHIWTAN